MLAGRGAAATEAAEETPQLSSELRPGDGVDDEVVRVDERVETVEDWERVFNDQVALSHVIGDEQTFARPSDVASERHEVQQVVDELPVGQGERDVQQGRRQQHGGHRAGPVRWGLLLMLLLTMTSKVHTLGGCTSHLTSRTVASIVADRLLKGPTFPEFRQNLPKLSQISKAQTASD